MLKKLLLFLFLAIFIACSSDQNDDMEMPTEISENDPEEENEPEEVNEPEEELSVNLLKITQNRYEAGNLSQKIDFIHKDNKMAVDSFYNANQQLIYVNKWFYNDDGFLSGTAVYLPNGTLNNENS